MIIKASWRHSPITKLTKLHLFITNFTRSYSNSDCSPNVPLERDTLTGMDVMTSRDYKHGSHNMHKGKGKVKLSL
jgi:hypothetical protein